MATVVYPNVSQWLLMTQDQVLDKFHGVDGAYSDGEGQKRFVYIEGKRKDRVLLVAHADTVFNAIPTLGFESGIFYSRNRKDKIETPGRFANTTITRWGMGIGADDRAGCAILWELRNLGHSLLITSGEESGGITAKRLMSSKWWKNELNATHQFAVQFDRRGYHDIVFYDVGTKDFVEYVKQQTGYKPETGTYTDIKEICTGICGVNMSVGYYNEHSSDEKLVYSQWLNTLCVAKAWLEQENLPKFELDRSKLYSHYQSNFYNHTNNYRNYADEYSEYGSEFHNHRNSWTNGSNTNSNNHSGGSTTVVDTIEVENRLRCPHCNSSMFEQEWFLNHMKCKYCNKEF